MGEKKDSNYFILYASLGLCGSSLLISGIFLGQIFSLFSIKIPHLVLIIFQIAFILSAIYNFWLIKYAKDKLS